MRSLLVIALVLGCKGKTEDKPKASGLVEPMREFCGLRGKTAEETKSNVAAWIDSHADNTELGELYAAALGKGDKAAAAKLKAAADAALGPDKCPFLDFILYKTEQRGSGSGQQ